MSKEVTDFEIGDILVSKLPNSAGIMMYVITANFQVIKLHGNRYGLETCGSRVSTTHIDYDRYTVIGNIKDLITLVEENYDDL